MAIFTKLSPDPFAESFEARKIGAKSRKTEINKGLARNGAVRRPLRGIQIKDDTYAYISVHTANKMQFIGLADSSARPPKGEEGNGLGISFSYSNFLLQSVQESRSEKAQIIETFGEPYVFFYGERPRIMAFSGVLINTEDFNWRAEWWHNYDNILRGTKCVENKARVVIGWDDIIVEGYILSSDAREDAESPYRVLFDFKIFLTNYANVSNIGSTNFPRTHTDVNQTDTTNNSISYYSSTQAVRSANTNQFGVGKTLLDYVRQGVKFIQSPDGAISNLLDYAGKYTFSATRLVAPLGYQSSTVFDTISIAAGSTSSNSIGGLLGPISFKITLPTPNKVQQSPTGPIYKNTDEYVSFGEDYFGKDLNIFDQKKILSDAEEQAKKVQSLFKALGIKTVPNSWYTNLLIGKAFDLGMLGASVGASTSLGELAKDPEKLKIANSVRNLL